MTVMISYDLDSMWTEVKNAALRAGFYEDALLQNERLVQLPNTTLVCDNLSAREALDLFVSVVRTTSILIVIERASAVEWTVGYHHQDPPRRARLALGALGLR